MLKRWQFRYSGVLSNIAVVQGKRTHEAFFSTSISPQPTAEERANLGFPTSAAANSVTLQAKISQLFDAERVVYRDAVLEDAVASEFVLVLLLVLVLIVCSLRCIQ